MPGTLLHQGATVTCLHSGQAQPVAVSPRVKVSGQPIVVQNNAYSIAACALPPNAGGPCSTAQWSSAATRIKSAGIAVLLQDSQALCTPTGTGLNIATTQTRVTGQ
ncbi:MAG: hypothetical protein V3T17_10845 [Pseudomonadales bacterium]